MRRRHRLQDDISSQPLSPIRSAPGAGGAFPSLNPLFSINLKMMWDSPVFGDLFAL